MHYYLQPQRIFTGTDFLENTLIEIRDTQIMALVPVASARPELPIHAFPKLLAAPGLIDLQIYGGGGSLFNTEITPDTIQKTYDAHKQGGTVYFQITLSTLPLEAMQQAIRASRSYQEQLRPGLLGLHLEGPYFNPIKRGAHLAEHVRVPTPQELDQWLPLRGDLPIYMTLAPEQCDDAVLDRLLAEGVLLSAGHSNATYAQAKRGFQRGIQRVTHLFNAMSPFQSREPGLVGATYDSDVWASIIADGIHCDFAAVRISKQLMGERLFLITDAVTEDTRGDYRFWQADGHFINEAGVLSGSALTMMQAVRNCVERVGIPLPEALRMASLYPARAVYQSHRLGRIAPQYEASLTLFSPDTYTVAGIVQQGALEVFE